MDDQDDEKKASWSPPGQNGGSKEPELPRPGAVSVSGAAPQGKPSRGSTRALAKKAPPGVAASAVRSDAVWSQEADHAHDAQAVAQLHNSGSNLEPMEPEVYIGPNVEPARKPAAAAAAVASSVRGSRRNDTKAAIRQETQALRSQGVPQGPGAVSVSTTSGTAAVAAPAHPPNSKAAIKREIEELRNNPELNRPGAHAVATSAQAESNRKGTSLTTSRSQRPSRRALKESGDQQSQSLSSSVSSSTVSKPGAQPSTAESTAAAEKALLLKTQDAKPVGAVQATAADDKSKTLKVDPFEPSSSSTSKANANGNSDALNKKLQDEKYDSKTFNETSKGIPMESSKDGMILKDASYNEKNNLHHRPQDYDDYDDNHNADVAGVEGLVAAQVIDEEELEAQYQAKILKGVVAAEIVSEDELKEQGRCWKMCCCCVLIIGIVLAISIPLTRKNDDLTYPPTLAPTQQPEYDYLYDLFYPYSGNALDDNTTAQYRALQWIATEDPLDLPIKESNETTLIERYSAAVLYYSTGGEDWFDQMNFLTNVSICNWTTSVYGLFCEETGKNLFRIDIDSNNLNGTVPTELLGFSQLNKVTLGLGLHGTLPSELGDMTALTFLQLFGHNITGTIPSTWNRLNIQTLVLFDNMLTGTIPPDLFAGQQQLNFIIMTQNLFTGPLPAIIPQSTVDYLYFDMNLFTGTIPQVYFQQDSLTLFGLSDNLLSGSIPDQIRGLRRLTYFYGSLNSFTGTILEDFSPLRDLKEFLVADNDLTGTIPSSVASLELLTKLSFAANNLVGTLPTELATMKNLINFNVSNNDLTGSVPTSYVQMSSLAEFDVSRNNLVGGLEESFCSAAVLSTSIASDCLGNATAEISCSCCSSCCNDEVCQNNLDQLCLARSAEFTLAPGRNATCDCQDGGASMKCTDTACESCNLEGDVCAQSTDYGYTFDEEGTTVSFHNVLQYTKGRNETIVYTKNAQDNFCIVEVNGQQCRRCTVAICQSATMGFQLDCSNLPGGPTLFTCIGVENKDDPSYLEVFFLNDLATVEGCLPIIIDLQPSNDQ